MGGGEPEQPVQLLVETAEELEAGGTQPDVGEPVRRRRERRLPRARAVVAPPAVFPEIFSARSAMRSATSLTCRDTPLQTWVTAGAGA